MRISDWSSDVCSSDLIADVLQPLHPNIRNGQSQAGGPAGHEDGGAPQAAPFRPIFLRPITRPRQPFRQTGPREESLLHPKPVASVPSQPCEQFRMAKIAPTGISAAKVPIIARRVGRADLT